MKAILLSAMCLAGVFTGPRLHAVPVSLRVTDESGAISPCRMHLRDEAGKAIKPPDLPFWFDHFVCAGELKLDLPEGMYAYEIERGPEHESHRGSLKVVNIGENKLDLTLRRIADLARDGWWSGETHIHRPAQLGNRLTSLEEVKSEIALHLRAEDLHIAPVITWWNQRSLWRNLEPPANPLKKVDGSRFFRLLGGRGRARGRGAAFLQSSQASHAPCGWSGSSGTSVVHGFPRGRQA